ncbi:hypothetical protein D3C78_1244820 [compost metagenome]
MVDVGRDDRAAAGDFLADELGGDFLGNGGAEAVAGVLRIEQTGGAGFLQLHVLADGDVFHLRRNDALARVVHLADVAARLGPARIAHVGEAHGGQFRIGQALLTEARAEAGEQFGIVAVGDPLRAHIGQALAHVDGHVRVGVGTGGVVDQHRRVRLAAEVGGSVGQRDLAHRHADVRARTLDVDLARIGQGLDGLLVDPGAFAQVLVFGGAHRRDSPRHAAGNVGANLKQETPRRTARTSCSLRGY